MSNQGAPAAPAAQQQQLIQELTTKLNNFDDEIDKISKMTNSDYDTVVKNAELLLKTIMQEMNNISPNDSLTQLLETKQKNLSDALQKRTSELVAQSPALSSQSKTVLGVQSPNPIVAGLNLPSLPVAVDPAAAQPPQQNPDERKTAITTKANTVLQRLIVPIGPNNYVPEVTLKEVPQQPQVSSGGTRKRVSSSKSVNSRKVSKTKRTTTRRTPRNNKSKSTRSSTARRSQLRPRSSQIRKNAITKVKKI